MPSGTTKSFIIFGCRNGLDERVGGGGESQIFPSKNSCLTVPKNFVGQTFRVPLISRIEKLYASEVYITILRRKIFVSRYRNIS